MIDYNNYNLNLMQKTFDMSLIQIRYFHVRFTLSIQVVFVIFGLEHRIGAMEIFIGLFSIKKLNTQTGQQENHQSRFKAMWKIAYCYRDNTITNGMTIHVWLIKAMYVKKCQRKTHLINKQFNKYRNKIILLLKQFFNNNVNMCILFLEKWISNQIDKVLENIGWSEKWLNESKSHKT